MKCLLPQRWLLTCQPRVLQWSPFLTPCYSRMVFAYFHNTHRVSERVSSMPKREDGLSNRQRFRQLIPPRATLNEIEALRLGKRQYISGKYGARLKKKIQIRNASVLNYNFFQLTQGKLPHLAFFAGAQQPSSFPPERLPEIAFVGRSNVGKSSLINALADSTVVRTSDKPGLTRQINFFESHRLFNLVDMPGYGFAYAKEEDRIQWQELIYTYLKTRKALKKVYVLLDARHGIKIADKEFLENLDQLRTKFQIVLTKCDLVVSSDLARRHYLVKQDLVRYRHALEHPIMVSAQTRSGIHNMRRQLLFLVNGLDRARVLAEKRKEMDKKLLGRPGSKASGRKNGHPRSSKSKAKIIGGKKLRKRKPTQTRRSPRAVDVKVRAVKGNGKAGSSKGKFR